MYLWFTCTSLVQFVSSTCDCLRCRFGGSGFETSGGGFADGSQSKFTLQGVELDREESRKAKVLYDYDATAEDELTIFTDQVSPVRPVLQVLTLYQPLKEAENMY